MAKRKVTAMSNENESESTLDLETPETLEAPASDETPEIEVVETTTTPESTPDLVVASAAPTVSVDYVDPIPATDPTVEYAMTDRCSVYGVQYPSLIQAADALRLSIPTLEARLASQSPEWASYRRL